MRTVIRIIVLSFFVFDAGAQENKTKDIITFNDGSEYRGNIQAFKQGEYVKIMVGGNLVSIDKTEYNNIKKIGFDKLDFYENRGFWKELQLGLSVGQSNSYSNDESYPSVNVAGGYQFSQLTGVGLGSGYQQFSQINIVPIYGILQGDLINDNRVTPYYYANLGYGIGIKQKNDFSFGDSNKARGGLLFGSGLGIRFNLKNAFLTTSMGYKLQKSNIKREFEPVFFDTRFAPSGDESITERRTYNRVEIEIGIGF